jgi:DNA-binding MarR family transcriptional regulator
MTRPLPTSLLMFIAARSASTRIFEVIKASGFDDLTLAQSRLLMGVDPDGTRLNVLAARAQVAKQTATALVDKLERAGYVERVPDPADGRARLVRLTSRALEVIPFARAEEDRIEAEWTEYLGAAPMAGLRDALEALREVTDPYR